MNLPRSPLVQVLLVTALGLGTSGCVGVGSGGPAGVVVGQSSEVSYGKTLHEKVILGSQGERLYEDEALSAYVNEVGQRLAAVGDRPDLPFRFFVIDDYQPNAFATMGGYVYVTRGLIALMRSEAELAAVIGHEIGHINGRHSLSQQRTNSAAQAGAVVAGILARSSALQRSVQTTSNVLIFDYAREQELEADRFGLRYALAAGYDPESLVGALGAMFDFREVLQKHGLSPRQVHSLTSTHPKDDRRLYELLRRVERARPDDDPAYGEPVAEDYLAVIEGLPWQESVDSGLVRDNAYYHGRRGVFVEFPAGWSVNNGRSVVVASSPARRTTYVQLETYPDDGERTFVEFIEEELSLELAGEGRTFAVDGFPGFLGVVSTSSEDYVRRLVAVVRKDGRNYVFKGENRTEADDRDFVRLFSSTVGSFRRMTEHERETVKGPRLVVRTVPPDTTYEALARRSPLGAIGPDLLRVLNGDYPNGQPRAGDRIKLIE